MVGPALDALPPSLRDTFARWWSAPLREYSAALWARTGRLLHDGMLSGCFLAEARRLHGEAAAAPVVSALLEQRVIATAQHVTPTNGPGFLAADRIAGAGRPAGAPLVVAAWSGVSVSNTACSGWLCFSGPPERILQPESASGLRFQKAMADRRRDGHGEGGEERLALVPSRQRDALLYRLPMPEDLPELLADLQPAARGLLADPAGCEDYPTWALRSCQAVQRAALGEEGVYYLDLNRIIAAYLAGCLRLPKHPLARLLFDPAVREGVAGRVRESWFYARKPGSKEKVAPLRPVGERLEGEGVSVPLADAPALLASGALCPGLVPAFTALRLNGLRCLGSFNQGVYLGELERALADAGLASFPADPAPSLISGRALDEAGREHHPLDLAVAGRTVDPIVPLDTPMSRLWAPIVARLAAAATGASSSPGGSGAPEGPASASLAPRGAAPAGS